MAGCFAGGITSFLTLPLDVIKTRRQIFSCLQNDSSLTIMTKLI